MNQNTEVSVYFFLLFAEKLKKTFVAAALWSLKPIKCEVSLVSTTLAEGERSAIGTMDYEWGRLMSRGLSSGLLQGPGTDGLYCQVLP